MVLKPQKPAVIDIAANVSADYPDFTETLDKIIGAHRFSVFSADTFLKNTRQQSLINIRSQAFPLIGIGILSLGALTTLIYLIPGATLIVAGLGLFVIGRVARLAPTSDAYNRLLEGAADPKLARIVLDWAQDLAKSDAAFYQLTPKNTYSKLSESERHAGNMAMILLGDERHRKALRTTTRMSDAPLLYFKGDHERIFSSLESALNKYRTSLDESRDIKTKEIPAPEAPNPTPSPDVTKNKQTSGPTPFSTAALKPKTKPRKSRPQSDSDYLKTLQQDYELLGKFIEFTKTDEYKAMVKRSKITRKTWTKVLKLIHKRWHEWTLYSTRKGDPQDFVRKLYGPKYLNYPPGSKKRNQFREGKYRDMGSFIKETGVIDPSRLVNQAQPDLFLDSKQ